MKIQFTILMFVFYGTLAHASTDTSFSQCDNHLMTVERSGIVSAGSYKKLINAYRKGASIRVGWELDFTGDGKTDVSHWVDAQFLSEFDGKLYAQVPAIQQQIPDITKSDILFPKNSQEWYGLLRSDSKLSGRYSLRNQMSKTYQVRSMWCLR